MRSLGRGLFWIAAIFGAIGLLLHLFVFDAWLVPAGDPVFAVSIEPTLRPGDRILVQRGSVPHTGQLARCTLSNGALVVGRVVGKRGDTVEVRDERAFVNGQAIASRHACPVVTLPHPVTGREITLACAVEDNGAWTYSVLRAAQLPEANRTAKVPPGMVYLLSDNRHFHQDSRDFGPVEEERCEHIVYRLWGESYADSSRRNNILW